MKTTQRDEVEDSQIDRGAGCCSRGPARGRGCGCCGPRWSAEVTAATRRRALEEHQRDLEQKLADVAEQLRGLSVDQPSTSE